MPSKTKRNTNSESLLEDALSKHYMHALFIHKYDFLYNINYTCICLYK